MPAGPDEASARERGAATREGRVFGLRLALALGAFELLLAEGLGLASVPGLLATAVYVLLPFALYGLAGFLAGPLFRFPAARFASLALFAAYGALRLWMARVLLRHPGGGLDMTLVVFALLAVLAAVVVLRAAMSYRRARLLFFHVWAGTLLFVVLWAGQSQPVVRAPGPQEPAAGASVVLVTWDTVRADVLSLYGGAGLETPNLGRLAREGTVYEQALAVAPITAPTHASMLTGLYPPSHGLRSNIWNFLSPEVPTLAEVLGAMGYETGAFVAAEPLLARFGLARGFQVYDDRMPFRFTSGLQRFGVKSFLWLLAARRLLPSTVFPASNAASVPGREITDRAAAWYRGTKGPAFLWVHYYDAHGPFDPPEPYRAAALAAEDAARPRAVGAGTGQEMMTLQRGEIALLDHELGRLLSVLEAKDPGLANTMVILTADHGECFGEGGIVGEHMPSLYEATQHVPLVIRFPSGAIRPLDAAGPGGRVTFPVSQIDLAPTVLYAVTGGMPAAAGEMQGMPLQVLEAAAAQGEPPLREPRFYMEAWQHGLHELRKQALRSPEWKFVRWLNEKTQLFRLPDESREAADGARRAQMAALLERLLAELPVAQGTDRILDRGDELSLQELGYAGDDQP